MPTQAVQHIRRMRGGAQSHLMRCADSNYYVVKFQNLCGAPHKPINVENSVMWSCSAMSHLCGVSRQAVSTLLRGL